MVGFNVVGGRQAGSPKLTSATNPKSCLVHGNNCQACQVPGERAETDEFAGWLRLILVGVCTH